MAQSQGQVLQSQISNPATLQAELARLQAENAALKARTVHGKVTLKIAPPQPVKDKDGKPTGAMKPSSGAVCAYGLGRFPVTLFASQWECLLDRSDDIRQFIRDNAAHITRKSYD